MPRNRIFLLAALISMFATISSQAQETQAVTDFQQIKAMVDSNRFEILCSIATTHHSYFQEPGTPYSDQNIRITNDSAFLIVHDSIAAAYLPYFSRSYSIPQAGARSIVFRNKMINPSVTTKGRGKRQSITYSFSIIGMNDSYQLRIIIQQNGRCYLYINSAKKSPISYIGQMIRQKH